MNHHQISQKYRWYNPAQISKWRESGEESAIATLLISNRPLLSTELLEVNISDLIAQYQTKEPTPQPQECEDIIETFLKCDNLRIVADTQEISEPHSELTLEVELEDIDDLVTEELAEIYSAQELIDEAIAIYTKLSLLNSEKSSYFAKLIAQMEQNRENN